MHNSPSALATVGFVGAGRTGSALALDLAQAGYPVVAVASRSAASAHRLAAPIGGCTPLPDAQAVAGAAELVFVTILDDVIAQVVSGISWRSGQSVVHCSGTLGLEPLAPAAAQGAYVASLHPFHTLAPLAGPDEVELNGFRGVTFGIEADEPLFDTLAGMAQRLGGTSLPVPAEARLLYHTSAVLVCGYFVALLNDAASLWRIAGLPTESAAPALVHLVQATLDNISSLGMEASQTGPVARGDAGTVHAHLEALGERAPRLLSVYRALAERAVELAVSSGRLSASTLPQWEELVAPPVDRIRRTG